MANDWSNRATAAPANSGSDWSARARRDPRQSEDYATQRVKSDAEARRRAPKGWMGALSDAVKEPLPVMDEIGGLIEGTKAYVGDAFRGRSATDAANRAQAVYLAEKDAVNEARRRRNEAFPVSSTIGGLLSGFAAGPVKGLVAKAPAVSSGALGFLKNNLTAAGVGGAYAGAYGFADSEGAERFGDAAKAVPGGLLAGSITHGGMSATAPVVKLGAGAVRDVVRTATRRPPAPGVKPQPTPKDTARAENAVRALAERKGLTPEGVRQIADENFAGKPVTAAEIMGREGVGKLAVTARREGETADALEAALRARAMGAPDRIKADFADELGVNADEAAGSIDAMVDAGRRRAAPLYDQALGSDAPVWNDELAGLSQRPAVRDAFRTAETSARNAGRPTEALGMSFVERPGFVDTTPPPFTAPVQAPARGPAKAPSRGKSLAKFIADGGGIRDTGGDVGAMAGRDWNKGKAFQRGLIGNGPDADEWALRAWEAGYFPQYRDRPSANQLLDALSDEMRGRPTYARGADEGAAQRFAAREASDEMAYYGGDSADLPTPEQYMGRPAPQSEPAFEAQPTGRSWDQVKRVLDAMVERDPITGKVVTTGAVGIRNRDLATASGDLRRALAGDETRPGAIPGYGEALKVSGDYLQIESAFNRARGKLTGTDVRAFGKLWASAKTPAEQNAVRAAIGADLLEMANRGLLRGGKLSVPGVQQKLEIAFGREGAKRFLAKMEAEASLARTGGRMMPGAGSPTDELGAAGAESAAALEGAGRVAGKAARGQWVSAIADGTAQVIAYARTSGTPVQVRDEYGRILMMGADEFADWLGTQSPQAMQRIAVGVPSGLLGGQVVGMASQ